MYVEEARDKIKEIVSENLKNLDADFWNNVTESLGKEIRVFLDEIDQIMTQGFNTSTLEKE
jgi:hypothetical protein